LILVPLVILMLLAGILPNLILQPIATSVENTLHVSEQRAAAPQASSEGTAAWLTGTD
jgi:NADH:ubiquinone oxidoreductase subunit 4 (subunit M)